MKSGWSHVREERRGREMLRSWSWLKPGRCGTVTMKPSMGRTRACEVERLLLSRGRPSNSVDRWEVLDGFVYSKSAGEGLTKYLSVPHTWDEELVIEVDC